MASITKSGVVFNKHNAVQGEGVGGEPCTQAKERTAKSSCLIEVKGDYGYSVAQLAPNGATEIIGISQSYAVQPHWPRITRMCTKRISEIRGKAGLSLQSGRVFSFTAEFAESAKNAEAFLGELRTLGGE